MIEHLKEFSGNTLGFACHGHVTREDYEHTLIPAVEQAFAQNEKVRLYYEIGPDFEHIDLGAVWADFATGMGHLLRWEKIAVVTDVDWIKNTLWTFGFLMPGQVRLFPISEKVAAKEWIAAG